MLRLEQQDVFRGRDERGLIIGATQWDHVIV